MFTLKAEDVIELPEFIGSTFRGVFGRVLKKVICIRRDQKCINCMIRNTCAYTFLFETELFFEGFEKKGLPRPFVLEVPQEGKRTLAPGERIALTLVLIGRGIDYLPYIIFAFEEMGRIGVGKRRGKFELEKIVDYYSGRQIYSCKDKLVKSNNKRFTINDLKEMAAITYKKQGSLIFVTPFRMKSGGQFTKTITFEGITRAIIRRYMYLAEWFFKDELRLKPNALIYKAKEVLINEDNTRWYDWQRFSFRKKEKMKLGGLVGEIKFSNITEEIWLLLLLGRELHIGKNTTFGLGQYYLKGD